MAIGDVHPGPAGSAAAPRAGARAKGDGLVWAGRIVSAIPVLAMAASAAMKLSGAPQVVDLFVGKFGYPRSSLVAIAALELSCAVLYAIPRTAVLGAALVSAYLGGAVATHVRVGDPFLPPIALGALAWIGLWLREPRLRALFPLRGNRG